MVGVGSWGDPKEFRESALRAAERASTTRSPDLKEELIKLSQGFLRGSVELERRMALWTGLCELHDVTSLHVFRCRLDAAARRVAECEEMVKGWRELTDRRQADGQNVAAAGEMLEIFQADLTAAIREKNDAGRHLAQGLREVFEGVKGRRPHTDQELNEWLASAEGNAATVFEPAPLPPSAEGRLRS